MRPALALALTLATAGAARADDALDVKGKVEALAAVRSTFPAAGPLDPTNSVLRLQQLGGDLELRPQLTVSWGGWLTLVARPRAALSAGLARVDGAWDGGKGSATVDASELSLTWRLNEVLAFTWGLQNFQWGPAELLSPSNHLFHETGLLRDILYFVRGKHLLRVNASWGKAWSLVALAELTPAFDPPFVDGEPFTPQGQVKAEWADEQGRGLVGLTGGLGAGVWPFLGEYFQWQLTDGLSVYGDVSHAAQRRAWYPSLAAEGPAFVHRASVPEHLFTTAVGGLRYTFESGVDLRLEVLFNEPGWTKEELERAASRPGAAASLGPLLSPGLEYVGRLVAYASARFPELPPGKRLTAIARYAVSATDGSGVGFVTLTLDASDAVVVFLSALVTHGPSTGEFSRLARAAVSAGASFNW